MSVINQIREATKPGNRLAFASGSLIGGIVPLITFGVAHFEMNPAKGIFQLSALLVLGGLVFSAITIYNWASIAFQSKLKAIGFVLLLDGTMVLSNIQILCYASLVYLVMINAVATASNLVLDAKKTRAEKRKIKPNSRIVKSET